MPPTFNTITNLTVHLIYPKDGFPRRLSGKESACQGTRLKRQFHSLCRENPLEGEMALHFSILAGRIPWTQEPGGL